MRVVRYWKSSGLDPLGRGMGKMEHNGCAAKHGVIPPYEIIKIDGRDYCLSCMIAAFDLAHPARQPWFFTGSERADDLLALGVPPIRSEVAA